MRETAFFIYTFLFFLVTSTALQAQQPQESGRLVGVVIDGVSMEAIPRATVKNTTQKSSVLADTTGYFTLEVQAGDTIIFEAMSYANDVYVVPQDFSGRQFAFIEVLNQDAVLLEEVEVRGFPSQEQFEMAFMGEAADELAEKANGLDTHLENVTRDETNMQSYLTEYNRNRMIYRMDNFPPHLHNPQPNNFLNPIRWANFIRDWREGRFSEEAVEKLNVYPPAEPEGETEVEPESEEGGN